MKRTNMAEAMNAAGITTPDQRRRQYRQNAIKRATTSHQALELYRERLEADPQAAMTLFTLAEIAQRARQDIEQSWPSATRPDAPREGAGGGHTSGDTQRMGAPADSTRGPAAPGVGGQTTYGPHCPCATNPQASPPPRRTGDAARKSARPKRTGAGTEISAAQRNCALDRLRINGRALRWATPEEAKQQAERWHIEARTVEAICTGLIPDQPVGEQLSDDEANERADRATRTTG